MELKRSFGRDPGDLRPVALTPGFMPYAEGSCLVATGNTRVICTATIDDNVPRWMKGRGTGWVTAEYSMLPRSSPERVQREVNRGRPSGRTQEIQRLVGRALRAVTDMTKIGERTVYLDCDVLQADGGTRTASITGSYVALAQAFISVGLTPSPLNDSVAGISVGIVAGQPFLDLDYAEDSTADVDMNVVMTGTGKLVEVQGTAEHGVFDRDELDRLLDLAAHGTAILTSHQSAALEGISAGA
ncbi:MAG: ribonuclease PH [Actinobacteria bacterium]|jgi:ribonuclease PH|nr:ribonuclease PH [Actinomycetota bacterium]MDQ3531186.1 ribonuclease PH [Actinomycetota bacterium]